MSVTPEWQSLSEVLRLLASPEVSEARAKDEPWASAEVSEAENKYKICRAIADLETYVRVEIHDAAGGDHAPSAFEKNEVEIPAGLTPNDFNWATSGPRNPWRTRRKGSTEWELRWIDLLQLCANDVRYWLCGEIDSVLLPEQKFNYERAPERLEHRRERWAEFQQGKWTPSEDVAAAVSEMAAVSEISLDDAVSLMAFGSRSAPAGLVEKKTKRYPSDLTDEEWARIEPFLPRASKAGRPIEVDLREVLNAIRYMARSGGGWRMLPNDFPPWQTVYWWFRRFVRRFMFQTIHDVALMLDRERVEREASPTGGVVDSQSVKAPEAKTRGYDAGKKIVGRKRHIAVDTDGRLLMVNLTPADISDSAGAQMILDGVRKRWPWLKHLFADGAYDRTQLMDKAAFRDFTIQIVKRSDAAMGFEIIPRRWVVERTFAWMTRWRRLVRDYEERIDCSEAMIHVALGSVLLRRIAHE